MKKEGEVVTQLEGGKQYLLYDATTAVGRSGYRAISGININRELSADNASPYAIWELQGSNNKFKVYNPYSSYYVPLLVLSTATKGNANGGTFTFTLNRARMVSTGMAMRAETSWVGIKVRVTLSV